MRIQELAQDTAKAVIEAFSATGDEDVYTIHIFLQEGAGDTRWDNGCPYRVSYYGVHCDRSYGGSEVAEEAVRERLPNALCELENDAEDAWGDYAREMGYSPCDFSLGVAIAVEEMV